MPEIIALRRDIERFAAGIAPGQDAEAMAAFERLKHALHAGTVRAANRGDDGTWVLHGWVMAGILLAFRLGRVERSAATPAPFF